VVGPVLATIGLAVALVHHYQNGISPLSRRFVLEPVTEHARRAHSLVEQVNSLPGDVSIAVGSNLYPQVGHRQRVYLFPTISDAQFVLLDTTGPSSPVGVGDQAQIVRELLDYAEFGVAQADHGFLLLERALDQYRLSPQFYEAFHAGNAEPQFVVAADFDQLLRLEGHSWNVRPVVRPGLVVEITTYWRALAPMDGEYRLAFYFWDLDRRLVRVQPEEQLVHWYPTWLWDPEPVIKVTLPPLPVGDLAHVGVAVLKPGAVDSDREGRLAPITLSPELPALTAPRTDLILWEENTILELVKP
jgi:hypothetical protein